MSDPRTLVKSYQYIDLPGEPPEGKLWPGVNNIIVLRKHRDVVFDIKLKAGATYTLNTDQPESKYGRFYDTRRKQTVGQATFNDGEKLHIWVGRRFQGNLILLSEGKEVGRYPIKKMDCTATCTDDPKDKPAPMIIAMNVNQPVSAPKPVPIPFGPVRTPTSTVPTPGFVNLDSMPKSFYTLDQFSQRDLWACRLPVKLASDTVMAETQYAHIVEVSKDSIPPHLAADCTSSPSNQIPIDTKKSDIQTWIVSQLVAAGTFYSDNRKWVNELWSENFRLTKQVHPKAGTRWYVVFTGNPRLRKYITAARYGVKNTKVVSIAGGAGAIESGAAAAWEGSKGAFKKAGLVALIFTVALDTAEWLNDYQQIDPKTGKPKKDFADLLGKIGIDFVKAGLSAAIASVIIGGVVTFFASALAIPMLLIIIGTVGVAIGVGSILDLIDEKIGATEHVSSWIRSLGQSATEAAEYLEKSMPKDYQGYLMMFAQ